MAGRARLGQLGTQGVEVHVWGTGAVLGMSQSPREMDGVWALLSCEEDVCWQQDCWGTEGDSASKDIP